MTARWGRRLRAELPFAAVLALFAGAVGYMIDQPGHWRRGTAVIAASFLTAMVLRLVLSKAGAGLLAIRARWIDVLCYLVVGALILVVDLRLHE